MNAVWASDAVGFGPQLVDFDGDGLEDVITGSGGQVILFRRQEDGGFEPGRPVAGASDASAL